MRRDLPFRGSGDARDKGIVPPRLAWKPFVAGFLLAGLCMLEVVLLVDALSTGSDPEVASTETETGPPSTVSGGGAREGMAPGTAAGEGAVAEASPDIVMPPPFMLESPIVSAEAGLPPPLWYDLHRHPEAPCAAIGSGGEAASWTESELVRGYWECYGEAAEAGSGYSLFSMLRGRSATEVGEIRLKITIEDDDRATEARQAFIAHVRRVFEIVGLPAETIGGMLLDGSGRREKRLAGARLMVSEEGGNGRSHNLIVLLPPAAPSFATMPFEYMPRLPGRVARPERRP